MPSPFYHLSLADDSLMQLFVSSLQNLEIIERKGVPTIAVADSAELADAFRDESERLRIVLTASGGISELDARTQSLAAYFSELL